jgi:hypothetical protein
MKKWVDGTYRVELCVMDLPGREFIALCDAKESQQVFKMQKECHKLH